MTALYRTRVAHHRGTPLRHSFRHSSTAWLVDLARLGARTTPPDLPRWLRPVVQFRASDHLGDPESRWYDNVLAFAATQGVDLAGQQVLALTTPRSLGHAFNPITVYWCLDGDDLTCAIAEVHNTYGERHAYLVRPDATGEAQTGKELYVSPFNDVSGRYTLSVPLPGDTFDVRVTLHRNGFTPFVATWEGQRVPASDVVRTALTSALAPRLVAARIRVHGIRLWARGLPIVHRPHHTPQESV